MLEGKTTFTLSLMEGYAGKCLIEVMRGGAEGDSKEPLVYLQKVEGCGYDVWSLTPDECDQVADALKAQAAQARKDWGSVTLKDREEALHNWENALKETHDPVERQECVDTIKALRRLIAAQKAQKE